MAKDTTRKELQAARRELEATVDKRQKETDAYLAANNRVAALEDGMPWWKKLP